MSFTHRFGNATPDDDFNMICDSCVHEECTGYPCKTLRDHIWELNQLEKDMEKYYKLETDKLK